MVYDDGSKASKAVELAKSVDFTFVTRGGVQGRVRDVPLPLRDCLGIGSCL